MARFSDVFLDETKKGYKIHTSKYLREGKHPIVDQGKNKIAGYTNLEEGLFTNVPAIIFGDHTRIVKYIDVPFFLGADGVKILKSKLSYTDYKYLFYCLANAKIPNTGYNRHFKWLKAVEIPLPPMEEQKKIAAVLDKVSDLIAKRRRQLDKLDLLVKARFVEMFGDLTINEKEWKFSPLSKLCDVRDGTHDSPAYTNSGYPLLTSKNFTSGIIDFTECNLISKEDFDKINQRSKVNVGDIIMPMIGTIGKPVIVNTERSFAIKNVALIKFTVSGVSNIFIKQILDSTYFKQIIFSANRGGTQKFIALGDIRKLPIPIVPIELQNKFADFVVQTEHTKTSISHSLEKLETLKKSLMQEYFG